MLHRVQVTIPSSLCLVELWFVFQQDNDLHTSRLCKGYFTKKSVMECCIRWPGLHNHSTSTQLRWFGISWNPEWRKSCQQVPSICGNSYNTIGKAFQVKLVKRMPRVCKAVIKAKVGYFEECKIYFDLLNTFLVTTWFHVLFHSFDVLTIILQCRK